MNIEAIGNDWGNPNRAEISRFLTGVTDPIASNMERKPECGILVKNKEDKSGNSGEYPKKHYRSPNESDSNQPHFVSLVSKYGRWSQLTLQFSHEFCHVLLNSDRLGPNFEKSEAAWFDEVVCVVASLYTLKRFAEGPSDFVNEWWKGKGGSILPQEYLEEHQRKVKIKKGYPSKKQFKQWLKDNEPKMRGDPYLAYENVDRFYDRVIADQLLPLFWGESKAGWNAVCGLPTSKLMLAEYLIEWRDALQSNEQRRFVSSVMKKLLVGT